MSRTLTTEDIDAIALRVVEEIGYRFATARKPEAPPKPAPPPPAPVAPPKLTYTLAELADELGVSKVSVYRLIQKGLITPLPYHRRKIFTGEEVERFLKEGMFKKKAN